MYAAIDLLADKLLRQIEKHKGKNIKASKNASIRTTDAAEETDSKE